MNAPTPDQGMTCQPKCGSKPTAQRPWQQGRDPGVQSSLRIRAVLLRNVLPTQSII
jgi:hypothetical protein